MKIISFFSDVYGSNYYEDCAKFLYKDCNSLELDFYIEKLNGYNSYRENCKMKPAFILNCISKFKSSVLWVDCDSRILKKPILENIESRVDYAGVKRNAPTDVFPVMIASTLFFNNTEASIDLLKKWIYECSLEVNAQRADHSILLDLIPKIKPIRFEWLPDSFGRIPLQNYAKINNETVIVSNLSPSKIIHGKKGTL